MFRHEKTCLKVQQQCAIKQVSECEAMCLSPKERSIATHVGAYFL